MGCVSSDTVIHDLRYVEEVEPSRPGHSAIYRSPKAVNGLQDSPHPGRKTIQDAFLYAFDTWPNNPCLGTRRADPEGPGPYQWKTYAEVKELATAFGSGLVDLLPK